MYCVVLEIVFVEKDVIYFDCIYELDNFWLDKGDVKFVCFEIWLRFWLELLENMLIVKRVDELCKWNDVKLCLEVKEMF